MNKRVLYIDELSPVGHVVFNRIQLEALSTLDCNLYCIFKYGYLEKIGCKKVISCLEIPNYLYVNYESVKKASIKKRLFSFLRWMYIKTHLVLKKYDAVIISSYDPLVLFFCFLKCKNIYVIEHNTVAQLENPIKCFFTQNLPKNIVHIVFNEKIKMALQNFGIANTAIVPHGLTFPFDSIKENVKYPSFRLIFCPSSTSVDESIINSLLKNEGFVNMIHRKRIILLLKGNYCNELNSSNVIILNKFLSDEEYADIFKEAWAIFIPYFEKFKYRISGVLFEAIANYKPVILTDIEAFRMYEHIFCYNPYWNGQINHIECIIDNIERVKDDYYKNIEDFYPASYWNKLLF